MSDIVFKYVGKAGEFIDGVPMRDLTQHDYDRLEPISQVNVRDAAFYDQQKKPKQNAEPAPGPAPEPDAGN